MNLSTALLPPDLLALYNNPIFTTLILLPAVLILLDFISGVGAALSTNQFDTKKLMNVLQNGVLPYFIANVIVLLVYLRSGSAVATTIASALSMTGLTATIVASIYSNFREFAPKAVMQELDAVGALAGMPDLLPPAAPLPPVLAPSSASAPSSPPAAPFGIASDWQSAHAVQVPPTL